MPLQKSSSILSWLESLKKLEQVKPDVPSDPSRYLFIMSLTQRHGRVCLNLSSHNMRVSSKGKLLLGRAHFPVEYELSRMDPEEAKLCEIVYLSRNKKLTDHYYRNSNFPFYGDGEEAQTLFKTLAEAGRLFWENLSCPIKGMGEARQVEFVWEKTPEGNQILTLKSPPEIVLLPINPIWYVSPETGEVGPIEPAYSIHVFEHLLKAPLLSASQTHDVALSLSKSNLRTPLPFPKSVQIEELTALEMQPVFQISAEPVLYYPVSVTGSLRFEYGKYTVPGTAGLYFDLTEEGKIKRIVRDQAAENQHRSAIDTLLSKRYEDYIIPIAFDINDSELIEFCEYIQPEIEAAGILVRFDEKFPLKYHGLATEWYTDLNETENDWFNLDFGILVEGKKESLLSAILKILDAQVNPRAYIEALKEGEGHRLISFHIQDRVVSLRADRLRQILVSLIAIYQPKRYREGDILRINRIRALYLEELERAFEASQLRKLGGAPLRETLKRLKNWQGEMTLPSLPPQFQGELRPYQAEGVAWLQFLRDYGFNGILADDMGLGKTVQTLAHLAIEKAEGRMKTPSLIIAPTSVVHNWELEARQFTPQFKTLVLHGDSRKDHFERLAEYDLILTTYPLLVRDKAILTEQSFYFLILDEAQYIKNTQAKMTLVVAQLKASHRLCLTGTPMENHLKELWSLFNFLTPGLLGELREFTQNYRTPIEKHQDASLRTQLTQIIKPFLLRRTKALVAQDLPEKSEIIRKIELSLAQRDLYEVVRLSVHKKVTEAIDQKGLERSQILILDALLKMRQVCCDPRLLSLPNLPKVEESAKLDHLMDMLNNLIAEDRKILLFSQFTSMLSLIEIRLQEAKIPYLKLTGQTKKRKELVEQFQNGKIPLFMISLKAGGVGLNLTAADTVIHYDPWWNPAVEAQASDRAHRIGQKQKVFVYKLIAEGTIEEKILKLQEKKRDLVEGLLSGKQDYRLTQADFDWLFALGQN